MTRRKRGGRNRPHQPSSHAELPIAVPAAPVKDQMRLELGAAEIASDLRVDFLAPIANDPLPHDVEVESAPVRALPAAFENRAAPAIGARLRAAREAVGLSVDEVARRVRISPAAVRAIESEAFEQLGPPVYARGYLKSYARAVELPDAVIEPALARLCDAPTLVATHAVPTGRHLASRMSTPLLYAVLTLFVVVPALSFVYQRAQLQQRIPKLERLDADTRVDFAQPAASGASAGPSATDAAASPDTAAAPPSAPASVEPPAASTEAGFESQQPVMASLAPVATSPSPAPAPAPALKPAKQGAQRVMLKLSESSWVELVGTDGSRIEYAMLQGGTTREYQIAGKAMLRIGNIRGARLEVDGQVIDLQPLAHANVARINLGEGAVTSAPAGVERQ